MAIPLGYRNNGGLSLMMVKPVDHLVLDQADDEVWLTSVCTMVSNG